MGTRRNLFCALALCLGLVAALAACQMDYSGSVMGTSRELHLKYTAFNTTEAQALDLEAGDEIAVAGATSARRARCPSPSRRRGPSPSTRGRT